MIKYYFLFFILVTATTQAVAQKFTVTGKITDQKNEPVPFASVFIKNTTKGVSANVDGVYKITVDGGTLTLVYKAIGYKFSERPVSVDKDLTVNEKLLEESYTLNNVVIRPNAEDPAYAIIRKSIKSRKKHLEEIKGYTVDVYTKGLQKLVGAPKKFLGRNMQKTLGLDSNGKGILYLSESQSKFGFKRPNQIHEEMVSSKVAGNSNAFSINKASDLLINFYDNLLLEGSGLSPRSFVSPISDNAMFYYKYKLLGTAEENGAIINKIEVIPRRQNDPAFRGVIYIEEDTWRLTGTNLNLTKASGVNFVDTLNISQQFTKTKNLYVPVDTKFQFNGHFFGFKFAGYFVGVFSNYNVNPKFPENYFTAEILKVTKAVNKKDSLYWANARPIPLTKEEDRNYAKKDSIALRRQSKVYLDSAEKANNKFGIGKLFLRGYTFNNRYDKKRFAFDPLISSIFYNTVEGLALKYGVSYQKDLGDRKNFSIRPEMRYGFKSRDFTANLRANYYYDPVKRANVGIGFGSEIADLNRFGTNSLQANSINSLFFETNLSKFYKKNFVNINTTRELADGLQASVQINYNRNSTLQNNTQFTFRDLDNEAFTSNNPFTPNAETPLFPTYSSLNFSANLAYTIGQKYITRPDGKFYQESKYPRFNLGYRKGIKGVLNSDVDYDLISVEIYQERIRMGLVGYSSIVVGAGKFLNNNVVYYPDSKHFWGNNSTVFPTNLRRFRYLDFYIYNTDQQYFEGHFEHNFAGFLMQKIPLVRKLKLEEYIGVNYLSTPAKRNYTEYYFGIQRLALSVSYGWAYNSNTKVDQGFRIAFGF